MADTPGDATEASATQQPVQDPTGQAQDGMRIRPGKSTYEWWYFDGQSDDGTAFQFHYQAPAADYHDPRPSVMIHLRRPDGSIAATDAFADGWRASTDSCDVTIGDSTLSGDLRSYRLHIVAGDLAADLTYTSEYPSWAPPPGTQDGDGAVNLFWLVAVPYGTFTGTLTYDGKTVPVRGGGYHDHNWGQGDLGTAVEHWYWGRVGLGDYSLVFTGVQPRQGAQTTRFILHKGGQLIASPTDEGFAASVEPSEMYQSSRGKDQPGRLEVSWSRRGGSDRAQLTLTNPRRVQETYEFSRLSGASRNEPSAGSRSPSYMSFLADAELSLHLDGQDENHTGKGIYEHRTFD